MPVIARRSGRTGKDGADAPRRPPTRDARGENFPVAARLIAPRMRAQVLAFYRFARAADDVADDPARTAADKLTALDAFEAGLAGRPGAPEAAALRAAVAERADLLAHARALLGAFRADARGIAIAAWDDLRAYCEMSAVPVGRFLLDLHDEDAALRRHADPLCVALQVLNHLQDMGPDHARLGRVYLPQDWSHAQGGDPRDLGRPALTPAWRAVADRTLDHCDSLIGQAGPLAGAIRSRGLRAQAAATLALARRLAARLRAQDPLARRVALSRLDFGLAGLTGLRAAAAAAATGRG